MQFKEFHEYAERLENVNILDAKDMLSVFEPVFLAKGYRNTNMNIVGSKILIIHDCGVGDFIEASATIREIRRIYPTAQIDLIMYTRGLAFAENCPYINHLYGNQCTGGWLKNIKEQYMWNLKVAEELLLPNHYDVCFCLCNYSNSAMLAYMSGAKIRFGMQHDQGRLIWDSVKEEDWYYFIEKRANNMYGKHDVDRYLSVVDNLLCVPVADRHIECWYAKEDEVYINNLLCRLKNIRLYALGIGGYGLRKHWPIEYYAELINNICDMEDDIVFIVLAGQSEYNEACELLNRAKHKRVINLAGKITFCQSAALMNRCSMYIGNDTSTVHIAAAFGVPVLTPNCYSYENLIRAELNDYSSGPIPIYCRAYNVPSVTVLPEHALDECVNSDYEKGCQRVDEAHCIRQITVEKMLAGYAILLDNISKKINDSVYIY